MCLCFAGRLPAGFSNHPDKHSHVSHTIARCISAEYFLTNIDLHARVYILADKRSNESRPQSLETFYVPG